MISDKCTGQEDRGGYGPDAGQKYGGTGNMKRVKARGVTSGLGGRGDLRWSSFGS